MSTNTMIEKVFGDSLQQKMGSKEDIIAGNLLHFALKSFFFGWVARFVVFIYAYMYHDWESLILIIWLAHSTLDTKFSRFQSFTMSLYLPLFVLIFCLYFILNMNGVYQFFFKDNSRNNLTLYGIVEF